MPKITFIEHDGQKHVVDAQAGGTVMEAAIADMVSGIDADCGGNCICSTCHCYVDPDWLDRLPPMEDEEEAMVEYANDPEPNSRLACQIVITDALDGLIVRLPESQS